MDRYSKVEKGQTHGEGAYGVVYKGKDRITGDFVAMKVRVVILHSTTLSLTICFSLSRKFGLNSRTRACRALRFAKYHCSRSCSIPTSSSE